MSLNNNSVQLETVFENERGFGASKQFSSKALLPHGN